MQVKRNSIIIAAIIIVAAATRLIPHPMNFAPLGALALFGSAHLGRKGIGLGVVFLAWFISDLLLNNFVYAAEGFTLFTSGSVFIYGSIVLIFLIGRLLLTKVTLPRVLGGALSASIIFFILSNLGVWFTGTMYPMTFDGLIACYTAAIPFFHNTLTGDLFYSGLMFLAYQAYMRSSLREEKA